ncbi:MAG: HNH endonuclease [Planctomycetes bacterium]|nr:HNH endonuclease [Planctomycetota bacterium]
MLLVCKKNAHRICTELGEDPTKWSRHCPLPQPNWFREEVDRFAYAARAAAARNISDARTILRGIRDAELRHWYIVHGQNSGRSRVGYSAKPRPVAALTDPLRSPKRHEATVLARDGYKCRYCGVRVIPTSVLRAFRHAVGNESFPMGAGNANKHGVMLAFCSVVDHVVDWSSGGRTYPSNLVTACWSCNYGKFCYSLEQLGIDDPRDRPPSPSPDWDGLTSLEQQLLAQA